mgnify:CR=1 FL=1
MRGMLRPARLRMIVFEEYICDVAFHGEMTHVVVVVPVEVDTRKLGSKPIGCYLIRLLEGLEEMVSMLTTDILDAKVINDKDKDNGMPFVVPESGCDVALGVSMLGKALGEEIVCQSTHLLQPIYPFGDLEVHPIVERKLGEVIFVDEFLGGLKGDVVGLKCHIGKKWLVRLGVGLQVVECFGDIKL